jgi:hypothetical protein
MRAGPLSRWAVKVLTRPRAPGSRGTAWDPEVLGALLRPADVLLVEGDQRISQVISYLTTSPWSHAALYLGAAAPHECVVGARAAFGAASSHLLVEALAEEGVVCAPLSKYRLQRVRICRPRALRPEDALAVAAYSAAQVGKKYDVDNILDLARYFLPAGIVPAGLRREALFFGAGKPTEVICSSLVGDAFASVGYPVLPALESREKRGAGSFLARVLGITPRGHRPRRPPNTLLVPRDFDLSPYFDVVKPEPAGQEGYPRAEALSAG